MGLDEAGKPEESVFVPAVSAANIHVRSGAGFRRLADETVGRCFSCLGFSWKTSMSRSTSSVAFSEKLSGKTIWLVGGVEAADELEEADEDLFSACHDAGDCKGYHSYSYGYADSNPMISLVCQGGKD